MGDPLTPDTPSEWTLTGRYDALAAEVAALRADREALAETLREILAVRLDTTPGLDPEQVAHKARIQMRDIATAALAVPSVGYAIDDHGPKADAQTAHNAAVPSADAEQPDSGTAFGLSGEHDASTGRLTMAEAVTLSRLAEIEARAQAATPGPWRYSWTKVPKQVRADEPEAHCVTAAIPAESVMGTMIHLGVERGNPWDAADAEFIAHAREDIPYLLAIIASAATAGR